MNLLALDIGGANLKAVGMTSGQRVARAEPFALWRQPAALGERLADLARRFDPFDALLITTTAELCDCFESKRQGVEHVLDASARLAGDRPLHVWSTAGRFVSDEAARAEPLRVAAANWHALATWVATMPPATIPPPNAAFSLLIDTGSTTTDLVPLRDGQVAGRGCTDRDRLAHAELVYLGAARTSLMALGPKLTFDGVETELMAEHFATMADVGVLRGSTAEDEQETSTADGRPLTRAYAAARVLRMIGADLDMLDLHAARRLAESFWDRAVQRIADAAKKVADAQGQATIDQVIISGSGGQLARAAALRAWPDVPRVLLADRLGPGIAEAACAMALIALRENGR